MRGAGTIVLFAYSFVYLLITGSSRLEQSGSALDDAGRRLVFVHLVVKRRRERGRRERKGERESIIGEEKGRKGCPWTTL